MASTEKSFTGTGNSVTYGATVSAYNYKYDANNRLVKLTHTLAGDSWSTEYSYDADGRQSLVKLDNGNTIEYVYGKTTGRPDKILLNLDTDTDPDYVVDWTYKSGANGSSTTLISTYTNGSGNTVVEYHYDACGKLISTTGSLASTLGEYNPIRYRGYYYDSETGLYYLQSRYYDPDTRRFINADDVTFLVANGMILSCNLFTYRENNSAKS